MNISIRNILQFNIQCFPEYNEKLRKFLGNSYFPFIIKIKSFGNSHNIVNKNATSIVAYKY
jgi:hypothetical protein